VCLQARIDVAVIAFGMDRDLLRRLSEQGVFVFVMVGTEEQARQACVCGANGLIAQGCEAGGHIAGKTPAVELLPRVLEVARGRPVRQAWWPARGSC
jgi:NAD(P)H-dependent flavin oxidoreductase YrpB (nitropropane dioxygenase family)